ncbi:MAG: flagellar assembly protein FliH [Spirochaetes bacterium]|nr:flagellar assembly protein FliH [Spirochaetota bacterium]
MGKVLFNAKEVYDMRKIVTVAPPPEIKIEEEEEYKGPTKEEIEVENRKLVEEAKREAQEIIDNANREAAEIIKSSEEGAFEHVKKATVKAKGIEDTAKERSQKIILAKENEVNQKIRQREIKLQEEYETTKKRAHEEGYRKGYESGKAEVNRLIKRLHTIMEGAIDKRDHIIEDAEEQIIRIVILIARKVVKAISEEQKGIVIKNIQAALDKIKGKTEVIVRVNTEDLELATEHKEELMQIFEELKHMVILEDTRVDRGGCIIETDFGSVDARIATQLQEIEEKVRELANISYFLVNKAVAKSKKGVKAEKAEKPGPAKSEEPQQAEPEKIEEDEV